MESNVISYSYSVSGNNAGIDWASWLTAISTLAMAIIAGIALNSWKKELRIKKRIEVYNKLQVLIFELSNFLEYFEIKLHQKEEMYFRNKLDEFASKFALLKKEIKIINNKELLNKIDYCVENVKSTFVIEKKFEEDVTLWPESFSSRFIHDKDFSEKLNKTLKDISEICEVEQQKFYN